MVPHAPFCVCVCVCALRTLAEMAAATSVHVVAIIEPIIQHADWFFPDGKIIYIYVYVCVCVCVCVCICTFFLIMIYFRLFNVIFTQVT